MAILMRIAGFRSGTFYIQSIRFCGILFSLIAVYGFFIEPFWLEIKHVHLDGVGNNEFMKGRTAVHLSDLHISHLGFLENRVLAAINEIRPDIIFLTGDYVKWRGDYEPAMNFLARLKAEYGLWAVMGDYDYSNSRKSCLFCHSKGSGGGSDRHAVHFLRNTSREVVIDGQIILNIGGFGIKAEDPIQKNVYLKNSCPEIILTHDPLMFERINKNCATLVLAGDTHGGQVPLPLWVWKILGYSKNEKYNHGFFQDGNKKMFVSKGIGTSHISFRFFCRPELVVLHF